LISSVSNNLIMLTYDILLMKFFKNGYFSIK
jgi:hypothetical protein